MMRFLGAAALVLAIITECFGAHSDRSRQRSGPIRSVPIGADVKRDIDFDCPEEFGYYPHPNDCTLYYVCVFGGALQESCTGGLMYSHELQTCDWPRNVGCDGVSAAGGDELERISEREPPQRTPPRRAPTPPPRVQPNPVVTSRGQPKFNRDEYEKQQQLYAEVDDLPPVEEIESDRQQRVYRGQPSTIGQVQKDRDGYSQVNSGRTFNSNIIPASIPQNNGKIGSFSFGTQVDERRNDERRIDDRRIDDRRIDDRRIDDRRIDDRRNEERRTATVTPAPQTYSENKRDNVTDFQHDRQIDIETNVINIVEVIEKPVLRMKRDLVGTEVGSDKVNSSTGDYISKRNDEEMEYVEFGTEAVPTYGDERSLDDNERGKRQIRYYLKNGFKTPGKNWGVPKQVKLVDLRQLDYNPNIQNVRHQSNYNVINNNLPEVTQKPSSDLDLVNSYQLYQSENVQSQRPFKPSLPDPTKQKLGQNPVNIATQIITKSPPISALKNYENPFASLTGGFYNNAPRQISNLENSQHSSLYSSFSNQPKHMVVFPDASHLSSTIVTGKTILLSTSPRTLNRYKTNGGLTQNSEFSQNVNDPASTIRSHQKPVNKVPPNKDEASEQDDESDEDEDESSENNTSEKEEAESEDQFKHDFPEPPFEFTHPNNRFKDIENPFANPNFDFDAFLTKLSGGQYTASPQYQHTSSRTLKNNNNSGLKAISPSVEITTLSSHISGIRSSTINYKGMSTPRPFNGADDVSFTVPPNHSHQNFPSATKQNILTEHWTQIPHNHRQNVGPEQQQSLNQNVYQVPQQNAGLPLNAVRPKLKPPNFKDDRQLPISYSFNRPVENSGRPSHNNNPSNVRIEKPQTYSVTQKPYVVLTGTSSPQILSTPKQQYYLKHLGATGKPYLVSSVKPHSNYIAFKQSTPKPLTTVANEQLAALQHFWANSSPAPESYFSIQTSGRPSSEAPKLENLFSQSTRPTPTKNKHYFSTTLKENPSTTTRFPPKRRPIPKPSPEMNDYYYDEDEEEEQFYYEPPVKSQYMPSTEVKPQRPPMAQNYKEYVDSYEDERDQPVVNIRPQQTSRRPTQFTTRKPETITKNYNDVSVVTKGSIKDMNKHVNGKIPVPVLINYATPASTVLVRPDVSNYEIIHHAPRNRTMHFKKPLHPESGPYTLRPPKYLYQTTLRPYTVRHRLAKPTASNQPLLQNEDSKLMRGRQRHQNIVAQMKHTTPRDSHNQETRYTKTKHDDKTNSLEPTENVAPVSYTASPRPKMLYNGSQNYNPDQYDPYYAVYDEDGELYKDTDYVQHYNTASLRPAVQQTYRGTPPPQRRPVETYTPRPVSVDDYDEELIQGQINNQNQYQSPIRQSTRGDGNELGYEHNPSSVKTTIYEATSISTTPSTTTSTTTTTQRTTSAPFTEAMTPSRYTARSSTDENPIQTPEPSLRQDPYDGLSELDQSSPSPVINLSVLAKPFEKTDNSHRLSETLLTTEKSPTSRQFSRVTNKKVSLDVLRPSNEENKKFVSLTSGFSIRRHPNNTNNQYTLTVLTRPFDDYNKSRQGNIPDSIRNRPAHPAKYYHYDSDENKEPVNTKIDASKTSHETSSEAIMQRKDSTEELQNEDDIPVYTRSRLRRPTLKPRLIVSTEPTTTTTTTANTKFYLKTVVRRPSPVSSNSEHYLDSTDNSISTEAFVNSSTENTKSDIPLAFEPKTSPKTVEQQWQHYDKSEETWDDTVVSPYKSLDNLRSSLNNNDNLIQESTTSSTSTTTQFTSPLRNIRTERPRSKPSYFSYRVVDDFVPDQTTEIFSGKVKNVLRAFFTNIASTTTPRFLDELSITTVKTLAQPEEKVVNIGFQKKTLKYVDEKPLRNNVKRLQIITEPSVNRFIPSNDDVLSITESEFVNDFSSTSTSSPLFITNPQTTPVIIESSANNEYRNFPNRQSFESKFVELTSSKSEVEKSKKFHNLLHNLSTDRNNYDSVSHTNEEEITTKPLNFDTHRTPTEIEWNRPTDTVLSEIASTTSTTKATSTVRIEPTSSTKSLSFPTRASRVNPAIKLAATNPGGGRRSYQTSSKCSSDNSLQANPKCNEIKYQRPVSTRGRGHAHYSTASDGPIPNRGTPPTRSRPTLKPSTAIVSKTTEFVDIYNTPPGRPAPVYPQPTPDKTAAKCRKDVCLLPDCSCGGRDIPGEMPVESVPQIVLLTFDDSVNDLNKALYADLFEKGRVNPNGCPIAATFYVSHEWTDYSQVQNLYAAGHEMASHTVSHSFGEQFSQKKWNREVGGQREILAAYGGVKLEDVRGMRAPFLSVGGNKMFKMLYDSNFTYDSSMPVYENRPPSWPYTLDYKLFHDCMIPPCPTKSYPGVWEVPMVMWQDLNGGRCSMGDACANPPNAEGVYKMILKNFDRHYTTNRAPFGLYYHAAWFTQPHHKEGFIMFLDFINQMSDVWIVTNWQALQWVRDPTPISRINNFQPFQCNYQDRPKKCNNPKVCNLWHKSGVRYMRTCQPCPEVYPWTGKTGIKSSRIDNDIGE